MTKDTLVAEDAEKFSSTDELEKWFKSGKMPANTECRCECATGGPCNHEFQGGQPLYNDDGDECGFETVCKNCGMGALTHSLMTGP